MIAKAVKGKGFRGALDYDLNKQKGHIINSNMAGNNPRELAKEFGEIRKLRPNLGKAVLHVSLSAAQGENLTDNQWREISEKYLIGMGLKDNQYVITRHTDTEHEHIHLLVNRITHRGEVISDSHDYKRQEVIMRQIEQDYGLQHVAPSYEAEKKAPTKGEIEGAIRTGQPSARQQLQQLCDGAAKNCHSFTEYQERLEAVGVALIPVVQLDGAKLSGLSYRLDGVTMFQSTPVSGRHSIVMKGSDLGKAYAAAGIQKRGISYEQNRDFPAVRRSIEREQARAFGEPDRSSEASQAPERGGLGRDAGAAGASHSRANGRDAADAGGYRPQEQGTGRDVPQPNQRGDQELERSRSGSAESRQQPQPSRAADGVEALQPSPSDGVIYSSARERLLALAGTADCTKRTGPGSGSKTPQASPDRSLEAIEKQITALNVPRFEVGIREAKTGQMMNREWSRAELIEALPWLKRMNAKGNDIYIRPAGEHGLVLVDDLKPDVLDQMKQDGYQPAATIETSPGNYQAWVKFSDQAQPPDVRCFAAQGLAKKYGGDMNSADSRHYGRLAGFTNQKPQHTRDGRQPYVLAHDCSGTTIQNAPEVLQRVLEAMDRMRVRKESKKRLEALKTALPEHDGSADPVKEYQRQAHRLIQRYGEDIDFSRLDWMIAQDMAKSGRFAVEGIEQGIRECSPHVESRKVGHIENYAKRTAEKAWNMPEVQQHRLERTKQKSRAGRQKIVDNI